MASVLAWLLLVVLCAVPLICWSRLSRDPVTRISVGLVMAAGAAGAIVVFAEWTYLTSKLEAFFSFPVLAGVVMGLGLLYERLRLGPRERLPGSRTPGGVFLLYLGMALVCGAPTYLMTNVEGDTPNSRLVLPLPSDLRIINDPEPECGSVNCSLHIHVAGRRELSRQQVAQRLRKHVAERGWNLEPNDTACRRAGVWFDRSWLCVSVYVDGDHAVLNLSHAQGWSGW